MSERLKVGDGYFSRVTQFGTSPDGLLAGKLEETLEWLTGSQAGGAILWVGLTVPVYSAAPTGSWLLVKYDILSGSGASLELYEDVTSITGGTDLPLYNKNRQKPIASGLSIDTGATVDDTGSQLIVSDSLPAQERIDNSVIVKSGGLYGIKLTNGATVSSYNVKLSVLGLG